MQKTIILIFCFFFSSCLAESDWRNLWHKGVDYLYQCEHQEASHEFDQAVALMSEEDLALHPYVLVARTQSSYVLNDYAMVLKDTELALESKHLTNYERLVCGIRRIAVFMKLGDEATAVEEYKKYIIDCPLFAKWEYFEDKIIIRNVPDCKCYQSYIKERIMADYCEKEEDICKYGNMWIVNISKEKQLEISTLRAQRRKRSPEEIRACCKTCGRCAAAADSICQCLAAGAGMVGGNWTMAACTVVCINMVEDIRQQCENNCYGDFEKPWEDFETWKVQYEKTYRLCPQPPLRCP